GRGGASAGVARRGGPGRRWRPGGDEGRRPRLRGPLPGGGRPRAACRPPGRLSPQHRDRPAGRRAAAHRPGRVAHGTGTRPEGRTSNAPPLRLRRILDAVTGRALLLSFIPGGEAGVSPERADLPGLVGALAATGRMTAAVVRAGVLPSVFARFPALPCGTV